MMSGVGIYGIKQLAKAQEHRSSRPAPNDYSRDNYNYPPQGPQGQGYWGPPGPPSRGPREDAYYGENPNQPQQQRQWYPTQPADGRNRSSADYQDEKYATQVEDGYQARDRQYNTPPPYGAQQQQAYQQPALPYEPRRDSPSGSGTAGLLSTAMQFVGDQQGEDGQKRKRGKGSEMINGFLSK